MQKKYVLGVMTLSACIILTQVMPAFAGIIGHSSASYKAAQTESVAQTTDFTFLSTDMYTYQKMESDINLFKQKYEGVTSDSIGTTPDGRNIYRIVIGNKDASKKILVIGAIHAREYITASVVMHQVKEMLDKRAEGDKSLDAVCIQYIPMLNPDGVAISQSGMAGLNKEESKKKLQEIIDSWSEWGLKENQDKYN